MVKSLSPVYLFLSDTIGLWLRVLLCARNRGEKCGLAHAHFNRICEAFRAQVPALLLILPTQHGSKAVSMKMDLVAVLFAERIVKCCHHCDLSIICADMLLQVYKETGTLSIINRVFVHLRLHLGATTCGLLSLTRIHMHGKGRLIVLFKRPSEFHNPKEVAS